MFDEQMILNRKLIQKNSISYTYVSYNCKVNKCFFWKISQIIVWNYEARGWANTVISVRWVIVCIQFASILHVYDIWIANLNKGYASVYQFLKHPFSVTIYFRYPIGSLRFQCTVGYIKQLIINLNVIVIIKKLKQTINNKRKRD